MAKTRQVSVTLGNGRSSPASASGSSARMQKDRLSIRPHDALARRRCRSVMPGQAVAPAGHLAPAEPPVQQDWNANHVAKPART